MRPNKIIFPHGLDPAGFLRDYWQQQPLLMRSALPDYRSPLAPEELAGLACEEGVEARLVLEKDGERPWEARLGPFGEEDFHPLPESHWTLLVQDVDKHVPEVARLLDPFRFIPDWRVDDVMVSYAPDQGSVGPHVDDYDVFLVQAYGRRRWRIHTRPVTEDDYLPGLDLRILPEFEAEQDWILEPGDVLYLPPNCAHWGTAEGECMTYSVGFRAPELQELARAWMETLIQRRIPGGRYRDPPLSPQSNSGEIGPEVIEGFNTLLGGLGETDPGLLRPWLGRYLTEPKENLYPEPAPVSLQPDEFALELERHGTLQRSGYARMAFCRGSDADRLFVNGRDFVLDPGNGDFLGALTRERRLHHDQLIPWLKKRERLELLCRLYNEGCFEFP